MPFGVARSEAAFAGLNPDLQKVERFGAAGIELTVRDAASRAHELNLAGLEHAAVAHTVLVLQRAFQHVTEDFHVAVRMRAKALSGRDAIVVNDAQRAEADMRRVVVVGKRESVV